MEVIVATPASTRGVSNIHGVRRIPMPLGTVAWIIMAPEMLASASWVLPCRTQMIAFMTSGSSVATGEMSKATTTGGRPEGGSCPFQLSDEQLGGSEDEGESDLEDEDGEEPALVAG